MDQVASASVEDNSSDDDAVDFIAKLALAQLLVRGVDGPGLRTANTERRLIQGAAHNDLLFIKSN